MTNLYAVTRLDRSTRGVANIVLPPQDRNPRYFEYADNEEQARQQAAKHLGCETWALDAELSQEKVERPFADETKPVTV